MKTKHSGLSFVQGRHTNVSLAPNGREKIATYPKPVFHRILNFVGAEKAASNLRNLPKYKTAKTMFCNPDSPQRPVREMALKDGKTVVMAAPRLREGILPLPPLDPHKMPSNMGVR
jgi:5-formyltetrahydrofolate cyclo-ligase